MTKCPLTAINSLSSTMR